VLGIDCVFCLSLKFLSQTFFLAHKCLATHILIVHKKGIESSCKIPATFVTLTKLGSIKNI
jgi:hypothetical protein